MLETTSWEALTETATEEVKASPVGGCFADTRFWHVDAYEGALTIVTALFMWGNVLVILVCRRSPPSTNHLFMLALAWADIAICTQNIFVTVMGQFTRDPMAGMIGMQISAGILQLGMYYTMSLLAAIALQRYFAVCHPTMRTFSYYRVRRLLVILAFGAFVESGLGGMFYWIQLVAGFFYLLIAAWSLAAFIMLVCYTAVGFALYKRVRLRRKIGGGVTYTASSAPAETSMGNMADDTVNASVEMKEGLGDAQASLVKKTEGAFQVPNQHSKCTLLSVRPDVNDDNRGTNSGIPLINIKTKVSPDSAGESGVQVKVPHVPAEVLQAKLHMETPLSLDKVNRTPVEVPVSKSKALPKSTKSGKMTKTGLTLVVVTALFFVFWVPVWMLSLGFPVPCFLRDLYVLNSLVNPLIYFTMSKQFRDKAVLLLLCRDKAMHRQGALITSMN